MEECPACKRYKSRPKDEEMNRNIKTRLNRIVGQINGVNKMVDDNRYCSDILIQIAAIENALKEVGFLILKDHMMSCVASDIKEGNLSSLEEAIDISKRLQ